MFQKVLHDVQLNAQEIQAAGCHIRVCMGLRWYKIRIQISGEIN